MDFEKGIDLNELSERINNLRNLEDQESNPELPDEYRNMDKETIIRMLLASQAENKKLHEKLDKQTEKLDRQDDEARAREERLNKRIDELTRINTRASENQVQMMDRLAELQRQTKQMNDQHAELLTELKRLKDLNRQSRKDKYNTTKQNVKKDKKDEDNHDDEQRGNRVQQKDDFNGDPETLKNACNNIAQSKLTAPKTKEERKYRQGMKYNKEISTKVYHHDCDESKLPEGSIILGRETRMLKSIKLSMSVHEYDFINVKYPDGHMDWVYMPEDIEKIQSVDDDEYMSHVEYKPFANTTLTRDSIPTLGYLRYALSVPSNRMDEMFKESGVGGCRQTIINWLNKSGKQLEYILPALKDRLLADGANVNCDETWSRLRREYNDGYKKVYVWCMVNKKEKIAYYFFDKPEEGTRSREVLTQFLGDAKIKSLQSDGYVGYVFLDDDVVDVEHIYCLAHVRSKFVTAYNIGKVRQAKPFLKWIGKLYKLEKEYKNLGLTPEQIKDRRNDEETSGIIQEMQAELNRLWPKDKIKQSEHDPVFATALRYLYNQWDGLMNYRNDGEYSIDNNIAERNVRPATVERKNSLSFASEGGIECSTTYHTIIQTCRMMGIKVLNYLQTFFEKFNEGCRDFAKMTPGYLVIN